MSFRDEPPLVDQTFWLTKDKEWMGGRKLQWQLISDFLGKYYKSNKALSILRAYFMTGKVPNWSKLQTSWPEKDSYRHLDLLCYLWLHPSADRNVLKEMRDSYIHSRFIVGDDIIAGQLLLTTIQKHTYYVCDDPMQCFYPADFFNKEELLFDLLYGDLSKMTFEARGGWRLKLKTHQKRYFVGFPSGTISSWLRQDIERFNYCKKTHILGYDRALDFYFDYFRLNNRNCINDIKRRRSVIKKELTEIYHYFDQDKNSPRAVVVDKLKARLDSEEYPEELKAVWAEVKENKDKEAKERALEAKKPKPTKYLTYASRIQIKKDMAEQFTERFNCWYDYSDSHEDEMLEYLSDSYWKFDKEEAGTFFFSHEITDDFNWRRFASLAVFLEEGSFYEEVSEEDKKLRGGYVTKSGVEKRFYELSEDSNGEASRILISDGLLSPYETKYWA